MISAKGIFESNDWIITSLKQGKGRIKIKANRKLYIYGKRNTFSEWREEKFVNHLALRNFGMKASELSCYKP